MSWFVRIEEACAAFIERAFANMFPSDLEPAQIARKLVATMEARTQNVGRTIVAPSRYLVFVNPADYARLTPHREYLEREWAALLGDVAGRVGIRLQDGPAHVTLHEKSEVVAGAIDIDAGNGARPDSGGPFRLRLVKGTPLGEEFSITGTARVGRNHTSDIFLADPSVSRNHAVLEIKEGCLVVRDAGSSNGTFVNGQRVEERTLRSGDVVAFGKTQMRVEND